MNTSSNIGIMFSGGLDTTLAAAMLSEKYETLHLVTFCNGICVRVDWAKKHIHQLQKIYSGNKLIHRTTFLNGIFSLLKKDMKDYFRRYKSPLIFDLCCRLAMETSMIIYCLEHNISLVADGNNAAQDEIFLQQPKYLDKIDMFFNKNGIKLIHPVYKMFPNRKQRDLVLKKYGIDDGNRILSFLGISSHLFNQPFCLWAPITFFFTSYLRHIPFVKNFSLPLEAAIEIRQEKEKLAQEYINDYFHKQSDNWSSLILPVKQEAFSAIRILKTKGKNLESIPKPNDTTCCGVAVRFQKKDKKDIIAFLDEKRIKWKSVEEKK